MSSPPSPHALIHIIVPDEFGPGEDALLAFMIVPLASLAADHVAFLKEHGRGREIPSIEPDSDDETDSFEDDFPYAPGPARDFFRAALGGVVVRTKKRPRVDPVFPGAVMYRGHGEVPEIEADKPITAYYRLVYVE